MKWKIVMGIALLALILVIGKWLMDSKSYGQLLMFSKDKKEIVTIVKDDLFGTEVKKSDWQKGFWFGLLPSDDAISYKIFVGALPLSLIFILSFVLAFIFNKAPKRKSKINNHTVSL